MQSHGLSVAGPCHLPAECIHEFPVHLVCLQTGDTGLGVTRSSVFPLTPMLTLRGLHFASFAQSIGTPFSVWDCPGPANLCLALVSFAPSLLWTSISLSSPHPPLEGQPYPQLQTLFQSSPRYTDFLPRDHPLGQRLPTSARTQGDGGILGGSLWQAVIITSHGATPITPHRAKTQARPGIL